MTVILLNPKQAGVRLGWAVSTLAKKRIFGGGPPFVRLGRSVRYPEDALTAFIESHRRYASTSEADATPRNDLEPTVPRS
jgi:hypothetical protein